jgi:hypothetical protein
LGKDGVFHKRKTIFATLKQISALNFNFEVAGSRMSRGIAKYVVIALAVTIVQ